MFCCYDEKSITESVIKVGARHIQSNVRKRQRQINISQRLCFLSSRLKKQHADNPKLDDLASLSTTGTHGILGILRVGTWSSNSSDNNEAGSSNQIDYSLEGQSTSKFIFEMPFRFQHNNVSSAQPQDGFYTGQIDTSCSNLPHGMGNWTSNDGLTTLDGEWREGSLIDSSSRPPETDSDDDDSDVIENGNDILNPADYVGVVSGMPCTFYHEDNRNKQAEVGFYTGQIETICGLPHGLGTWRNANGSRRREGAWSKGNLVLKHEPETIIEDPQNPVAEQTPTDGLDTIIEDTPTTDDSECQQEAKAKPNDEPTETPENEPDDKLPKNTLHMTRNASQLDPLTALQCEPTDIPMFNVIEYDEWKRMFIDEEADETKRSSDMRERGYVDHLRSFMYDMASN